MNSKLKQMSNFDGVHKSNKCATCLYLTSDEAMLDKKNCLRFARFVDHLLNDNSRDCEYWQSAEGLTTSKTGYGSNE
jgi:hypothetical protein